MKKTKKQTESVQTLVTRRYLSAGKIVAWTDGACEPNPGRGGWGYSLCVEGSEVASGMGGEADTTNNRMELMAIIEAIRACRVDERLIVRTDSQLCLLCAVGRWKRKANLDMWAEFDRITKGRSIEFEWWRGHMGTTGNERADELAAIGRFNAMNEGEMK